MADQSRATAKGGTLLVCSIRRRSDSVIPPQKSNKAALYVDLIRVIDAGLILRIGGFECDGRPLFAHTLKRGLSVIFDQGHDDFAGLSGVGFLDDHIVAVENAGID